MQPMSRKEPKTAGVMGVSKPLRRGRSEGTFSARLSASKRTWFAAWVLKIPRSGVRDRRRWLWPLLGVPRRPTEQGAGQPLCAGTAPDG